MNASQHVHLVTTGPVGTQGLDVVNERLKRGWRVALVAPMGAAGGGEGVAFAALVVLERRGSEAEDVLVQIEEEIEETLEGDGAGLDLPPEPGRGPLGPSVEKGRDLPEAGMRPEADK